MNRGGAVGREYVMSGLPLVGDEFAGYRTRAVLGRGWPARVDELTRHYEAVLGRDEARQITTGAAA